MKKEPTIKIEPVSLDSFTSFPSALTDEQAISHLKSNGYRITKMIETEF